jgi:site-specific DNA-methyltransferase (adenine-specific)
MDWGTPQEFFDNLNKVYKFQLDVCADDNNCKCDAWLSDPAKSRNGGGQDALIEPWRLSWQENIPLICWMNSPYGRELPKWIDKAILEVKRGNKVVCLVPARTDTKWFAKAWDNANAVWFVRGRLTFEGAPGPAPFPSAVFDLQEHIKGPPYVGFLDKHGIRI